MSALSFSSLTDYSVVKSNKDNELFLMAKFTAKKRENTNRNPLAISAVLDVSGSMAGTKIETLKKTMTKLVKHLSSDDYLGIVTFQTQIHEILHPTKMNAEGKHRANKAISEIVATGGTNMSGGIIRSFDQFKTMDLPAIQNNPENRIQAIELENGNNLISREYIRRMIVFTDGQANDGLLSNDIDGFVKLVEQAPEKVSISTFGYGNDHDEKLLSNISNKAKGGFYYIENEEQISQSFGRELGGLMNCIGQNLKINIETNAETKIIEVISDNYTHTLLQDGKILSLEIPDIYAEETMRCLVKLSVPKPSKAITSRNFKVATVNGSCMELENMKVKEFSEKVKIKFDDNANEKPNPEVIECIALLSAAKASRQAIEQANQGNFANARSIAAAAAVNIQQFAQYMPQESLLLNNISNDMNALGNNTGSRAVYAACAKSVSAFTNSMSLQRSNVAGNSADVYYTNASVDNFTSNFVADDDAENKKVNEKKDNKKENK